MPTTIYLTNTASDLTPPGGELYLTARVGVRGAGIITDSRATSTIEVPMLRGTDILSWYTPPLDAVTIAGTITINWWMSENNMSANVDADWALVRYTAGADGATIDNTGKGVEVPVTTRAAQNWTRTPISTGLIAGDRLKIRVILGDALAQASGFTADVAHSGVTSGADGDSFVTFTETITEQVTARVPRFSPYPQLLGH